MCFLFCGAVLKYLPVSPVRDEGIPFLFVHNEYQLFQLLLPTTLLRAEELSWRAAVLVLFLTGSIASTVAMELPGCGVAELTPCTSVDACLTPYCICSLCMQGARREQRMAEFLHSS